MYLRARVEVKWKQPAAILMLVLSVLANPLSAQNVVFSPDADAWVRNDSPHKYADVFLEGDRFSSTYTLTPAAGDIGKQAQLYLVAKVDRTWYMHDGTGFKPWKDGQPGSLQAYASKVLAASESIPVISDTQLFAGNYAIYAGYRVGAGELKYGERPLRFRVEKSKTDQLLRFRSSQAMEDYIKSGMEQSTGLNYAFDRTLVYATAERGIAGASRVSGTNLQVSGVDEADTVKVSGSELFMLKSCESGPCLQAHSLDTGSATSALQGTYLFSDDARPDGLYLVEDAESASRTLVSLSGQNSFWGWFTIWGWSEGKTTLEFLDASNPAAIQATEKLVLDGALVASRRVQDTLYVVTRYTPALDSFLPYALDEKETRANRELLDNTSLEQLLPRVTDAEKNVRALVESGNCYLPASAVDGNHNPSIITITSISLQSRQPVASTCFLGSSETLYMTTDSLYLATTSWDYAELSADALVYSPRHSTTVHKFALASAGIEYRGSAEVGGHLGWTEDKKSFRMGENGDYLNIVTSVGDSWSSTSSTRLTVLKDTAGGKLEVVSITDGIGKPGEQLYAARFFGDRAYLVTFRITDPLYVVDLSNQAQPRIAGELELAGYSDYLHPVSETLLLGIGKDAIAEERPGESGEARGAWYQGLKLALFDVSDPSAPREIDSKVLGKRGTESEVLWDHHAFTWLPANGSEPARFAIPVRLHDRFPDWEGFDATDASAWYDYTQTALYSFEVSELGLASAGELVAETRNDIENDAIEPEPLTRLFAPYFLYYADRSVLADDAVYYLHNGEILSSFWGESK